MWVAVLCCCRSRMSFAPEDVSLELALRPLSNGDEDALRYWYDSAARIERKGAYFSFGGVGLANKRVSVFLESPHNELVYDTLDGKRRWLGGERTTPEAVLLSEKGIVSDLGEVRADEASDLVLVLFSPEKVEFIDLTHRKGGFYRRLAPSVVPGAVDLMKSGGPNRFNEPRH
jgi:hypothetical protein